MSKILFFERQRFKQLWIFILLLILNAIFIYGIYRQLVEGEPFGNNPMSNVWLILAELMLLVLMCSFFVLRLDTQITAECIYVRYFPLHLKYKSFAWKDIKEARVRKYGPMREFGGWGIRIGKKGKAYTVSGNMGLQIIAWDAKKNKEVSLLVGTRHPELLEKIIREITLHKE